MSERKKKLKYFFENKSETSKTKNSKLKAQSQTQNSKMSSSASAFTGIVNVGAFDKAAKSLVGDYVRQALGFISKKYNFSAEEAMRDLNMEDMAVRRPSKKTTIKKVEKPSIPMPWTGAVADECCQGLRLNHGLYTQCAGKKVTDGEYCKTCVKQCDTNSSGKPNYGTVEDRKEVDALEFRDPKGKQVLPYANVMKKLGISKEKVDEEALKFGLEIADEQFVVREPTRGRKKKETATTDTPTEGEKIKRGRPKKEKKVVSNTGDDLIAALVANVQNTTTVSDAVIEPVEEGLVEEILDAGTLAVQKKALSQEQVEAKAARELARKEKADEKEAKRLAFEEKKKEWAAKKELAAQEKETKRLAREAKQAEKAAADEVKRVAAEAKKAAAAEKKAQKEAEKEVKRVAAEAKKAAAAEKKAAAAAAKEEKRLEREAKKAEKDAEKEAKRLAAEQKKTAAAAKKAAFEAEKAALVQTIADEKEKLDAPELTVEPLADSEDETAPADADAPAADAPAADAPADEDAESDDEETEVVKFEHNGITYLKDTNNVLYDMKTQEEIGTWDDAEKCIQDLEDDSDEEAETEESEAEN